MSKYFPLPFLFLFYFPSFAQDGKEILKMSYERCQSIQNGYYELMRSMKYPTKKDTIESFYQCSFKKLKNDSLFSSAFHYKHFWKGEYSGDVLYTGEDFVTTNPKDSTATIMSKARWANEIKSVRHNYKFYSPLINRKSLPLPQDSDFTDNRHTFKFIGEEDINSISCYHVQMNEIPQDDSTDMVTTFRIEYHFWISKLDLIPVQYSTALDMVMANDTMYQYEKNVLIKYELDNLTDSNILTLNSIPTEYAIKDYVPYIYPELLKKDTIAPDWELTSLTDEKISLNSLKGNLVLVDFFYKSCYPCMKSIPALQALNEKFKDKGLKIVGIDPYDKKEDDIAGFLAKRGVTYTVFLNGMDVAKEYRVSAYPTMYLIDRNGKIIFIQEGFDSEVEEKLEEIIRQNL